MTMLSRTVLRLCRIDASVEHAYFGRNGRGAFMIWAAARLVRTKDCAYSLKLFFFFGFQGNCPPSARWQRYRTNLVCARTSAQKQCVHETIFGLFGDCIPRPTRLTYIFSEPLLRTFWRRLGSFSTSAKGCTMPLLP